MEKILKIIREKRNFTPRKWIYEKLYKLNKYMLKNNLSCCVISVSGGIDSAVTYKLCKMASELEDSPIKKVIGIAQPIHSTKSIWERALLIDKDIQVIDQSDIFDNITQKVSESFDIKDNSKYADGQLKSYMRTPMNYYVAQLMTSKGYPAIVIGTGNYDEDGYLYYFCKAGDGVVDVQLISELHKSEVYNVAKEIGVPKEIIEAKPSADLWEGQTDEEEMGVTYDFIELYTELLKMPVAEKVLYLMELEKEEREKYEEYKKIAINIHNKNKHKVNFPINL